MLVLIGYFLFFCFFEKFDVPLLPEFPLSKPERERNLLLRLIFMRNKGQRHIIKLIIYAITACQTLKFSFI